MYFLLQYFERCSRFKKTVDARLKEFHLTRANIHEDSAMDRPAFISKKKGYKEKIEKNKALIKEKDNHLRKKPQIKRFDAFFEELADSEAAFFQIVNKVKKNLNSREEEKVYLPLA